MPDANTPLDQSKPTAHSDETSAQQVSAPNGAPPASKLKRIVRPVAVLALVLLAGFLFWRFFLRKPDVPPNIIQVTGRVEGDDAAVSAKTAGRIREINVREGDQVTAGQVIAVLDDVQVKAREEGAQSAVEQAEARRQRAEQQIGVLRAQLEQAQLGVAQARADAQGRVHQAEAQVAAAEAQLAQAEAGYSQARYDAEKFTKLAGQGDASERTAVQARTAAEAQRALVQAAHKQVDAARGSLQTARANLVNPQIRSSQASAVEQQIAQAQVDVTAANADIERARAQFREAEANRSDLQIVAPFDGTVATRTAEPGEVVAAGTPIVTIVNLNKVYLRAFVPEGEIGRVKPGQAARVYLDTARGGGAQALEAIVERIDPEASFTPENTYFREERVKQVVGVKLALVHAQGFAKPGMPADGEILVEGTVWPLDTGRR
ncbi:MAG TPA: HlyD family efflux transporter periplasmic adaptor subunit [Pyrinomonadaceae bacterium]|nr:HlyD family efflux transporter periplasmic adaptor subunit [Pyrinomonadaceae bacterium]